jgi:hypothetical protein
MPGGLSLIIKHRLPDAGVFSFNSIGLLGFWSLICTHLVAEEINNSIIKKDGSKSVKTNDRYIDNSASNSG